MGELREMFPVYLLSGFLDSGKTTFINNILRDGFAEEDKTLLISCEEGEVEYDSAALKNVTILSVDDPDLLTPEFLLFEQTPIPMPSRRPPTISLRLPTSWLKCCIRTLRPSRALRTAAAPAATAAAPRRTTTWSTPTSPK